MLPSDLIGVTADFGDAILRQGCLRGNPGSL